MGRIFEKRKTRMFARWAKMSKAFTKMGRELAVAVKQGGPDPSSNPRLRMAIQTAKSINMPKDRIQNAIKRASSKTSGESYQEILYEGYAPHGVAIMVETATDNPLRTVANLRSYFNRAGGNLATNGSVSFLFEHKGLFKIEKKNINSELLSLSFIDAGGEDIEEDDKCIWVYTDFSNYHQFQKFLEGNNITILNSELQRIANTSVEILDLDAVNEILKLVDKLEEDDDVQAVFHNLSIQN